jgi:flavin-dependent dehydrogenase
LTLDCDVVVVGGGPAGATTARLLANWGYRTVVADSAPGPRAKVGEILAPSARQILTRLGLVQALDEDQALARPCLGVVSDWGRPHRRDYLREPGGHGWILDRAMFERRLATEAIAAGAEWRWNRRLLRAALTGDGIELHFTNPAGTSTPKRTIRCAFAIDATGRPAALGRRLGAVRRIATRRLAEEAESMQSRAEAGYGWVDIVAGPDGWSYVATGPGGVKHHVLFGGRSRRISLPSPGSRAPSSRAWEAGFSILAPICGERWLAVGDAAAAFDPLTSQGLPQALASGLAAAHAVRRALAGDHSAAALYHSALVRTWLRSLRGSEAVYASEGRWPHTPFWRTAQAPADVPS